MTHQREADELALRTFELLRIHKQVLVTAESCTAGLIAATLSRVPGVSTCLAGSFVVYQVESKVAWLDVPREVIEQHDVVSSETALAMAVNALDKTPHATMSLSITGHLGPQAPDGLDGVAWLGYASRHSGSRTLKLQLSSGVQEPPVVDRHLYLRHERQKDAVLQSLGFLCDRLAEMPNVSSTASRKTFDSTDT